MAKVLVVDDAPDIVRLLSRLLTNQGYQVLAAYSGPEALKVAWAERPDVVLLDIGMPGMDGIEVCRRMKADEKLQAIPVVLVTAKDLDEDVVAGLDAGADDYVIKPFNSEILAARLRSALRVKSSHDTIAQMNQQLRAEIAERKRAEEEATSLKQRIEFILGATKTRLAVIDSDFRLLYVDPEWQKAYGDPAGNTCYEYIMGRDKPCADCALVRAMQTNNVAVSAELLPKENNRPVQITAIPFRNEKGERLYAEVNVDISERKLLERELAQAQKLEAIGHLAAGIAHEINTPIQYIGDNTRFLQEAFGNFDELLTSSGRLLQAVRDEAITDQLVAEVEAAFNQADVDYLGEEIPKAIGQSLEGIDRVAAIVRAMRDFSHPGSKRKQPIDLNHAIKSVLTVCRNEWKYVAHMVTDFDTSLPPIACLPGDFNQAILNIVVNAAQAIADVVGNGSHNKGTIIVRTRRVRNWAEIRIQDSGAGIPEHIRSRVFDPFFTTKQIGKGTGQGLAIAHSIVTQRHGGTITFETEAGRGTTFIIRLPIRQHSASRQDTQPQEAEVAY